MDQASGLRGIMKERVTGNENPPPAFDSLKRKGNGQNRIRVISVTSGKGGVGKTNTVANLAFALSSIGKRVLILDADLGLANMDVMLGLNPKYTLHHVLKGEKRIDEIMVTARGGFQLLPAASGIQELTELDDTQRLMLLNELDVLQDYFDVLLIDTGAGISSNVMYFNYASMEKIVIVTNEPTSLTDAYALIKVLTKKYQQKRFKILVNSARNKGEADQIYRHLSLVADKFLDTPSLDYLGWIPYDEQVPMSIRRQQMILEAYPESPASKSLFSIAEKLSSKIDSADFEGDIKFFWRKLLEC